MKVAFWNGVSPSDGVTNHMAAIGTMLALHKKCEVVLGSNHISNHMLQDCFSSRIMEEGRAHAPYQFSYGEPEYFRALWDMKRNRQGDVLEMPMEGITIIYPPDVTDKSMFYYKVPWTTLYLLDVTGDNTTAFQSALEEADVVVVFLPQDVVEFQKILYRCSYLIPNALFVIEGFQKKGNCSVRLIEKKCGIDKRNIAIFPHNEKYTEACEEGSLAFYLKNNLRPMKKEPEYFFVSSLRHIANLLYEYSVAKDKGGMK